MIVTVRIDQHVMAEVLSHVRSPALTNPQISPLTCLKIDGVMKSLLIMLTVALAIAVADLCRSSWLAIRPAPVNPVFTICEKGL
jgi:hypothetical protein